MACELRMDSTFLEGCPKKSKNQKRMCDRERMAHNASNIYYLAIYRKSLPTPGVH